MPGPADKASKDEAERWGGRTAVIDLWRRFVSSLAGCGLLLALALPPLLVTPAPARADDLSACLKAMSGYDEAKLAFDAANPNALRCTAQAASGDIVMAAVIAAMTAIMASGAYDSESSCEKVVNTVIASVVVDVFKEIEGSVDLAGLFGQDFVNALNTDFSTAGVAALHQALAPLFDYIDCGCAVSGTVAQVAQDIKQAAEGYASCGSILVGAVKEAGKIVGDAAKGVGSFFELVGEGTACIATFGLWCLGSSNDREPAQNLQCIDVYNNYEGDTHGGRIWCGPGAQCATVPSQNGDSWNGCAPCTDVPFSKANGTNQNGCGCQANFKASLNEHGGLASCSCNSPFVLTSVGAAVQCLCPQGSYQNQGACSACMPGHISSPDRSQCLSCAADQRVSSDGGSCQQCPAGQGSIYDNGKFDGQCHDLSCPAGQHRDVVKASFSVPSGFSACQCDAGTVMQNGKCVTKAVCEAGQHYDSATNTCPSYCPTGQVYEFKASGDVTGPGYSRCVACAGSNMVTVNNQCVQCQDYERAGPNNTCNAVCAPGLVYTPASRAGASDGNDGRRIGSAGLPPLAETGGQSIAMTAAYSCQSCPSGSVGFDNTCHTCAPGTKPGAGSTCVSMCGDDQGFDADSNQCVSCKPGDRVNKISTLQVDPKGTALKTTFNICAADPNGRPSCRENEYVVNDTCVACPAGQKADLASNSCQAACGSGQVYAQINVPAGSGGFHPSLDNPGGQSKPATFFACTTCANPTDVIVNNQCVQPKTGKTAKLRPVRAGDYGLTATQAAGATVTAAGLGVLLGGRLQQQRPQAAQPAASNDPLRRPYRFPFDTAATDTGTGRLAISYPPGHEPGRTREPSRIRGGNGGSSGSLGAQPDQGSGPATGTRQPTPTITGRRPNSGSSYSGHTLGAEPDGSNTPPSSTGAYRRGGGRNGYTGVTLGAQPGGSSNGGAVKLTPAQQDKLHAHGGANQPSNQPQSRLQRQPSLQPTRPTLAPRNGLSPSGGPVPATMAPRTAAPATLQSPRSAPTLAPAAARPTLAPSATRPTLAPSDTRMRPSLQTPRFPPLNSGSTPGPGGGAPWNQLR